MNYFAQIDGSGYCVAVTQAAGPLVGPQFVPIDTLDVSLIGMRWTGFAWVAP